MRRLEDPSVALGAAAVVAIAALVVGGKLVYGTLSQRTPKEPEACCKATVEVIDRDGARLGCTSDAALTSCGALDAGDRAIVNDGHCVVTPGGMSAVMRVLSGLKLDLNTATADDLSHIDAISPALAHDIVAERDKRGRFTSVDALTQMPGIGAAKLADLQKHLEIRTPKGAGD